MGKSLRNQAFFLSYTHERTFAIMIMDAIAMNGKEALLVGLDDMRLSLLRYCRHMTGSSFDAEDLVQETMVRLLKVNAANPERDIPFRYACRTARNLWIDLARRKSRLNMLRYRDETWTSEQGSTGAELYVREHLEELAWYLPPKPFVILLLMDVFDFTAKETAAWLGGSEVAVQVALSRARARMKGLKGSIREKRPSVIKSEGTAAAKNAIVSIEFFEAVLDAFRRREPSAIQDAYLNLITSGARLQSIRAWNDKKFFTFQDPDGNLIMVTSE